MSWPSRSNNGLVGYHCGLGFDTGGKEEGQWRDITAGRHPVDGGVTAVFGLRMRVYNMPCLGVVSSSCTDVVYI